MSLLARFAISSLAKSVQIQHLNALAPAPVLLEQTRQLGRGVKKRRKTYPFWWWPKKDAGVQDENITESNLKFVEQYIKDKYSLKEGESPLKEFDETIEVQKIDDKTRRTGVIAKKIGIYPMWTKNGTRILTTVLQVVDNHVIKYYSPEKFQEICRPWYRFPYYKDKAVVVVGAESTDPRKFDSVYLGLFDEAGVMPKNKLTHFFITPNAKLDPGTPLNVTHFRVGDCVDCHGKSKDRAYQGVIVRWKMTGRMGLYLHGCTKAHRRAGTINISRKLKLLRGHKMPGHMGCERRRIRGVKIWRINTKHNVMWVSGPAIPGAVGSWVYVFDTKHEEKKWSVENPPPFPTHFAESDKEPLPEDIYDKELHAFDDPTIIFEETEAEKKALLAAAKMQKKAKVAKIKAK